MSYILPTDATTPITGLYTLFLYLNNDVCDGYLFISLVYALGVIFFIALKDWPNSKAFATASFFVFVFSLILSALRFLPETKFLYLSIVLFAVGIVWAHIDNRSSSPV